jgi:DNA-binding NarL/FixJ family response regulator
VITVVLAENNYLVREGTRRLHVETGEVDVVDAVGDADALRTAVDAHLPDVVVTDIRMPPGHHLDGIGSSVLDADVVDALIASRMRPRLDAHVLTPRELDVLAQMARGRTNAAIAAELHLSESAIEKHINSIFSKLGVRDEPHQHSRVQAVLTYLERR